MKFLRINFIFLGIVGCVLIIIARLVFLQIINGEVNKALANGQQKIFQSVSGQRGEIFLHDKDKLVLAADNQSYRYCYLSPRIIKDKEKTIKLVAPILGIDENKLFSEVKNNNSLFLLLKKNISDSEEQEIVDLKLKGVNIGEGIIRHYPLNNLASDVLGFVNNDNIGQYGVEGFWNNILSGKEGLQNIEYGPFGRFFQGDDIASMRGADIVLTIDKNIQEQAETLLADYQKKFEFSTGQIIVVSPKDGKILALADFPSFNPNQFEQYGNQGVGIFQDKNIQALYEPGSTFKAITMAAALNEGKITPKTTYIDKGFVDIGRRHLTNYDQRVYGETTMTKVLEKSINTGAIFAESQIGHNVFVNYLKKFGIFEKTNIGLQGEVSSENKEFKKCWEVNFVTASYGQGIDLTPIQMARAYCAIANKGKMVQPYIVEGALEGRNIKTIRERTSSTQVISPDSAQTLTKMLISVVDNGYGKPARVPGYYVAGKTGTSQIPYSSLGLNQSGYSNKTWQSFIGFAPALDPKFVILVKLDNPKTRTASESAIFLFQKLTKYILDYYQVLPDK